MAEKQIDSIGSTPPRSEEHTAGASSTAIRPSQRKPHDENVLFEEYNYYAQKTREDQDALTTPRTHWKEIVLRKKSPNHIDNDSGDFVLRASTEQKISNHLEITDEEWINASRAYRTASAGSCFYLITT